jgi:hypothetical protein
MSANPFGRIRRIGRVGGVGNACKRGTGHHGIMWGNPSAPRVTTKERIGHLRPHQIAIPVVVGLTLAVIAAYWGWNQVTQRQDFYGPLYRNGVPTTGVVLQTDPQNHNLVEYSYQIESATYTGWSNADGPDGPADQLRVGQSIRIVYDRMHPGVSCDCIPTAADASAGSTISIQIMFVFFILVAIPIAIGFSGSWQPEVTATGLWWYRRRLS